MGLVLLGWIKNLVVMKADNKGKQLIVSLLIRVKNSIFHVQSYTSISPAAASWAVGRQLHVGVVLAAEAAHIIPVMALSSFSLVCLLASNRGVQTRLRRPR